MWHRTVTLSVVLATLLGQSGGPSGAGQGSTFDPLRDSLPRDEPQPIYDRDPSHPWNRLFHLLFTRTLKARLAAADANPFVMAGDERLALSDRTVTRIESGDRAIEPLYPSWVWMGSATFDMSAPGGFGILKDPQYQRFVEVLEALPSSRTEQPPLARALMQADLWAAYDLLHATLPIRTRPSAETVSRRQRTERLLPLLAKAIRALALTRSEISALPDTYAAARQAQDLPDLFNSKSGWIEIRWFPTRMHEHAVDSRRAARVFLKPAEPPADERTFLNSFPDALGSHAFPLDAVALVIQNLLVASDGSVAPSAITYEVQVRRFDAARSPRQSDVVQFELSRQQLLERPHTGGLRALDESSPVYLPIGGNDFSFAAPPALHGQPVLVPLRHRCSTCHTPKLEHLITFSMHRFPGRDVPPVIRLSASEHAHPLDVAARKMTLESWKSLQGHWPASR